MTKIEEILSTAKEEFRKALFEHEAKTLLKELNIDTPDFAPVRSPEEAVRTAEEFGYPVALKVISPQIIHKSDAGGVVLNLRNANEVRAGCEAVISNARRFNPAAEIRGVLLEKMVPPSHEIIIGTTTDPQFGPTLMLGMGGIYVEIYKDVTFRVAPINRQEALEMIDELKGSKVLKGYRGQAASDVGAIVDLLLKAANLAMKYEAIDQIDLNPVVVYPKGLKVVDTRIILKKE